MEFPNHTGKVNFARTACGSARAVGHLIHRPSTKIHEITSEGPKVIQKFLFRQEGKGDKKSIPNSPVEPRVLLIEELPGSRRRLAHEEHSYTVRTITLAKGFSSGRILPFRSDGLSDGSCRAGGLDLLAPHVRCSNDAGAPESTPSNRQAGLELGEPAVRKPCPRCCIPW